MCEYSRKGMRVLTQVDESTYVIHRLYGKNRHSKLITHHSKLITEKTLHEASAYTPACMCQRFSMCKPMHIDVFAIGCIIFRRNLLDLSVKPSKGFSEIFGWQEPHDGCTTRATAFTMNPKRLSRGCRSVSRWLKFSQNHLFSLLHPWRIPMGIEIWLWWYWRTSNQYVFR